ncbi:MAG: prolipoprotein diacylglyceryl transferase [Patescibacteria group bacterium]
MFLHTYLPSQILISFGPFAIHWYGLCMVLGIAAGWYVARFTFRRARVPAAFLDELVASLVISGFLGARLYHVVNEFGYYWAHPLDVFAVWRGGLAIHGALIGGLMVLCWFVHTHQMEIKQLVISFSSRIGPWLKVSGILWFADLLSPSLALGQAIGRWGNYFRQELYGLPTSLPWGIPITLENRLPGYERFEYFHPVFFYESLWLTLTTIILLIVIRRLVSPPNKGENKREDVYPVGLIFFLYLILAGLGRFFIEFLRIDPMPLIFGVRLQQLVSAIVIIVGSGGIVWLLRLKNSISLAQNKENRYDSM